MAKHSLYSLKDAKKIGRKSGLLLLETDFVNAQTPMTWQCMDCNNLWFTKLTNIRSGRTCPACNGKPRLTPEELQRRSKASGLDMQSYDPETKKAQMQCHCGKTFELKKELIGRRGCPCSSKPGRKPIGLASIQAIAKSREGQCLSDSYSTQRERMRFECSEGHQWETTPNSLIHQHSWCPVCNKGRKKAVVKSKKKRA